MLLTHRTYALLLLIMVTTAVLTGCSSGTHVSTLQAIAYQPGDGLRFRVADNSLVKSPSAGSQNTEKYTTTAVSKFPEVFTSDTTGLPIAVDYKSGIIQHDVSSAAFVASLGLVPMTQKITTAINVTVTFPTVEAFGPIKLKEEFQILYISSDSVASPLGLMTGQRGQGAGNKVRSFKGNTDVALMTDFYLEEQFQAVVNCLAKADQAQLKGWHAQWQSQLQSPPARPAKTPDPLKGK